MNKLSTPPALLPPSPSSTIQPRSTLYSPDADIWSGATFVLPRSAHRISFVTARICFTIIYVFCSQRSKTKAYIAHYFWNATGDSVRCTAGARHLRRPFRVWAAPSMPKACILQRPMPPSSLPLPAPPPKKTTPSPYPDPPVYSNTRRDNITEPHAVEGQPHNN